MKKVFSVISVFMVFTILLVSPSFSIKTTGLNDSSVATIEAMYTSPEQPVRFVVMGDSRSNPHIFTRIIDLTNSLKPDFVLHTGDIVERGEEDEYIKIMPLFDKFQMPIVTVPGNHEISKTQKNLANYEKYFGSRNLIFETPGIRYIMFDNSYGYLKKAQLQWVEEALKTKKMTVLCAHVPSAPTFPNYTMTGGSKEFEEILKKGGCDYVFFAHVHGYDHRMIGDNCHAFITGGAGAELNGKGFAKELNHVILVTVDKGKVEAEIIPLPKLKKSEKK